jgi:hypothetical protein
MALAEIVAYEGSGQEWPVNKFGFYILGRSIMCLFQIRRLTLTQGHVGPWIIIPE